MIISMESALSILLVALIVNIIATGLGGFLSDYSHMLLMKRIELKANSIVNSILFAPGDWRCKYNGIPVPSCVDSGFSGKIDLPLSGIRCYIDDPFLRNITGCNKNVRGQWVYEVNFEVCIGSSPFNCNWERHKLLISPQ